MSPKRLKTHFPAKNLKTLNMDKTEVKNSIFQKKKHSPINIKESATNINFSTSTPTYVSAERAVSLFSDENNAGQRIDNFLTHICKGVPKSHIYQILRSGQVRVNKKRITASYRLNNGDEIRIPPIRVAAVNTQQQPSKTLLRQVKFPIIYEDECLLIINKPVGIAVHGGSGIHFGVIEQLRLSRPDARFLELVHRLDRETSGLLLIAKKRSALLHLHTQLRENQIDKRYLVCVYGDWHNAKQIVKAPLYKYIDVSGERRVQVSEKGQPAHTVFTLIEKFPNYALLEALLKTGRTHQIRVHLSHLGKPIVGDDKYGDFALNRTLAKSQSLPHIKRMFLHAAHLEMTHPLTGERVTFNAPLPKECEFFLAQLKN